MFGKSLQQDSIPQKLKSPTWTDEHTNPILKLLGLPQHQPKFFLRQVKIRHLVFWWGAIFPEQMPSAQLFSMHY